MQNHNVTGNVNFPLNFPIKNDSYESAAIYANTILNNKTVLKVEMEVHTSDGKIHLVICDEFDFKWN